MKRLMTSYVLRIYRRDRAAQEITGIVEIPERGARFAFRSFAELKNILNGGSAAPPPAGEESGGNR